MNKYLKILIWTLLIILINYFGRYVFVYFSKFGYHWYQEYYIYIAGSVGVVISMVMFFLINFILNKKRNELRTFAFNTQRFLLMFFLILLAFIGERLYLFTSDYFLYN